MNERCVSKLYAPKRRGTLSNFHMQMESMTFIYTLLGLKNFSKIDPLGWDDVSNAQ